MLYHLEQTGRIGNPPHRLYLPDDWPLILTRDRAHALEGALLSTLEDHTAVELPRPPMVLPFIAPTAGKKMLLPLGPVTV